ncbi:MAG TPA: NAD(P)-binding domain-containing protein [Streptosporangiaceae bacterium]|nr:NAD(P)-binding domain-containing protein [Streptosporangiaceae bacterium]
MKIAVIGTGNIGGTLGAKWHAAGHEVTYGSRQADGDEQTGPGGAPLRPVGAAIADAGVVVLAVPAAAVASVVAEHATALDGKIVVDATNRMGAKHPDSQDAIRACGPGVQYVRAFNSYGWENFADPWPGTTVFFAADPAARAAAEELISAAGLEPAYVGGEDATDAVNGVGTLWMSLVQQRGGQRRLALRLLG